MSVKKAGDTTVEMVKDAAQGRDVSKVFIECDDCYRNKTFSVANNNMDPVYNDIRRFVERHLLYSVHNGCSSFSIGLETDLPVKEIDTTITVGPDPKIRI